MTTRSLLAIMLSGTYAVTALPAVAQDDDAAARQQLVNNPDPATFEPYGTPSPVKVVKDKEVQGGRALLIPADGVGKPFAVGMNVLTTKQVRVGDKLSVMFYAKLQQAEPGVTAGKLSLRLQLAMKPYPSFADKSVEVGPAWKLYSMDAVADRDYAPGALSTAFQFNSARQVIAMGVVAVFDKGQ